MRKQHSLRMGIAVLLVAAIGLGAAHGGGVDPTPFVGDWINEKGSTISATCGDVPLFADASAPFSISVGTDSDLVFHLSCHCDLPLAIVGQQARLLAPTLCSLFLAPTQVTATVTELTLDLSATPPKLSIIGADAHGLAASIAVGPCQFAIEGALRKASNTPTLCGPDTTAVGILTDYDKEARDCHIAWIGAEHVDILLSSNDDASCPRGTGAHGEGSWVLPQAERADRPCASAASPNPEPVHLQFCRVDGRMFKPLTTDPDAREHFYAVLMLGSECPNGSEKVAWQIDTPEMGGESSCVGAVSTACGQNRAVNLGNAGSTFHLAFCLFRAAVRSEDTMSSFPTMPNPYGVFHDFDGPQPPWVTLKRWGHAREGSGNRLVGVPEVGGEFSKIVQEDSEHGLSFEMALIR